MIPPILPNAACLAAQTVDAGCLSQVIYRRETLMLLLDVCSEEVEVDPHRSQAGMPQDLLQAKDVTPVEQVLLGESMPKSMW